MNLFRDLFYALLPPVAVVVLQALRMATMPHAIKFDVVAHLLGGAAIAWSATILWRRWRKRNLIPTKIPAWIAAWCAFGAVLLASVSWELFEFMMEQNTGWIFQPSKADTLNDLVMGMLGGALFVLTTWKKRG